MKFLACTRAMAGAVAQARATTMPFTFWAALGALVLPVLAGADNPCADVTDSAIRNRADIRAWGECAPASALQDGTAEPGRGSSPRAAARAGSAFGETYPDDNGFALEADGASGAETLVRRAGPPRAPDPAPVLRASWRNTLGAEFMWIPAGKFLMGSPATEEWREPGEVQHEVRLTAGFWMGKHEVTRREWLQVTGTVPGGDLEGLQAYPVQGVSWLEVQEFIGKLNERESGSGYVYRLPTEAEWEYAARAGATGARYGVLEEIAWYSFNTPITKNNLGSRVRPVGQKPPNAWGLHDVLGNVGEWVADWHGPYPASPVTDPMGPSTGTLRAARGGSCCHGASSIRFAWRAPAAPTTTAFGLGFRLVRTMPTWTNTLGMEFVWIRAGTFHMGSPDDEKGRRNDELQHPVTVAGFWLGKHEITRQEWQHVMGSYPPSPPHCGTECPVASVSWADTQEFIRNLHRKESAQGYRYRLPTEAEWEYAARAGTTGPRHGELDAIAWYLDNSDSKLNEVGLKRANA